ncbi:MAG: hypothetical protein IJR55_05650 [Clostridia bacterium]|nr:hypothetical protein [Clostridia bacterium]
MKTVKKIFSKVLLCLVWVLLSTVIWSWLFNIKTDVSPKKKITVFIDAESVRDDALADYLSSKKPEKIMLIQVHPFSYAMFDEHALTHADIYIVGADNAEKYIESFLPLDKTNENKECFVYDGVSYGIKIYDAQTGDGSAGEYIDYGGQDYYLFYGVNSPHAGEMNGSNDGYAIDIADEIIKLK